MRIPLCLTALAALAVSTSWTAGPKQNIPQTAPLPSASTSQIPSGLNDVRPSAPMSHAQALTQGECEQLGGTVHLSGSICASGYVCTTVDNYKVKHEVCLSKAP